METTLQPKQALIDNLHETTFRLMWSYQQEAERAFEPLGLTPLKAVVIALLGRAPHHPKDLSTLLETAPPAISVLLSDLEDRGFVTRKVDPLDRRRFSLELTDAGKLLLEDVREAWQRNNAARLSALSTSDLETLHRIQTTLLEA